MMLKFGVKFLGTFTVRTNSRLRDDTSTEAFGSASTAKCAERFVLEAVMVFRHNDEWAIEERFVLRSLNFVAALPSNALHLPTVR